MRNKTFLLSTLIFALSLLAGCGGGGSSDGGGGGTGADSASYSFLGASASLIEKESIYNGYNDPEIYAELFTSMSNTSTHIVIEDNLLGGYPYDRKLEITYLEIQQVLLRTLIWFIHP